MKNIVFVLHSHIPYVKGYGEWPHGEEWLYEVMLYSYVPLFKKIRDVKGMGWTGKIVVGFTPVLLEMLKDPYITHHFLLYIDRLIENAEEDRKFFSSSGNREFVQLALMWKDWVVNMRRLFADELSGDITEGFRMLSNSGSVELIASAATHPFLPLLSRDETVREQIETGISVFEKHFGFRPSGFWLPECGYRPPGVWVNPVTGEEVEREGIEDILSKNGITHLFLDPSVLGVRAWGVPTGGMEEEPIGGKLENGEVPRVVSVGKACGFVRDVPLGMQVWSRHRGYPGDGRYLEFHKKHERSGFKYWRVTDSRSDLGEKRVYDPAEALGMTKAHSDHFIRRIRESEPTGNDVIPLFFDTELYGHWWFEGTDWLGNLLMHTCVGGSQVRTVSPRDLLSAGEVEPVTYELRPGSWGEGGGFSTWFNEETKGMWAEIYEAEKTFYSEVAQEKPGSPLAVQVSRQAKRELFLLMSSDWPFLVATGQGGDYGWERFRGHLENFTFLTNVWKDLRSSRLLDDKTISRINEIAKKDHLFF